MAQNGFPYNTSPAGGLSAAKRVFPSLSPTGLTPQDDTERLSIQYFPRRRAFSGETARIARSYLVYLHKIIQKFRIDFLS
jgi:hypothetical protein